MEKERLAVDLRKAEIWAEELVVLHDGFAMEDAATMLNAYVGALVNVACAVKRNVRSDVEDAVEGLVVLWLTGADRTHGTNFGRFLRRAGSADNGRNID